MQCTHSVNILSSVNVGGNLLNIFRVKDAKTKRKYDSQHDIFGETWCGVKELSEIFYQVNDHS